MYMGRFTYCMEEAARMFRLTAGRTVRAEVEEGEFSSLLFGPDWGEVGSFIGREASLRVLFRSSATVDLRRRLFVVCLLSRITRRSQARENPSCFWIRVTRSCHRLRQDKETQREACRPVDPCCTTLRFQ
jgi:hypothetical protein